MVRLIARDLNAKMYNKFNRSSNAPADEADVELLGAGVRLKGKRILIMADFQYEDMELMYPKMRLEEEGCEVVVVSSH